MLPRHNHIHFETLLNLKSVQKEYDDSKTLSTEKQTAVTELQQQEQNSEKETARILGNLPPRRRGNICSSFVHWRLES